MQPLKSRGLLADFLILTYLGIFTLFWVWTTVHFVSELRAMAEIQSFLSNSLGINDRQVVKGLLGVN